MTAGNASLKRAQQDASVRAPKFLSVGQTHVGLVRDLNEDALLNRPDIGLWAVADGMGGHAGGDVASRKIVEALETLGVQTSAHALRDAVTQAVDQVNSALLSDPSAEMIGSTVVTLLAHQGHYACLWAGDSRAYLYRHGALKRLTRDHSVVQDLVDAGTVRDDEARQHPQANVITRAVGAKASLKLDETFGVLQPNDRFLLCSDGLTAHVSDREIAEAMRRSPLERGATMLVDLALSRGGRDNVTVVLVSTEGGSA